MANPYSKLFRAPGSRGFALAALLARMPISMTGIGLITMLAQMRGAYGLAGAVAATFAFCTALLSPQVSRLVDRYGQGRVLPRAAGASIAAMLALLLCAHLQAPDWTLFLFAALAGCMPSMSAMSRARWTAIYRGQPELQTAYALESVLDEVCFIAGPPLSVGLSVALFPEAGPLAAALLLGMGVAAFVLQRGTEPPLPDRLKGYQAPLLAMNGMRVLMLLMVAMGTIAGTIDVVSVAFARQEGEPAAASIVLSMYAIGSCVAGLAFGALHLQQSLPQLLRLAGLATAATTLPLLFVNNILSLSAAVLLAGLFFAPTLIVAMGLVERMVPNARLTEGLTWLVTGLGIGLALGAAAAGQLVDLYGARAGFGMALAAGCVVLFTVLYGQCHLEEAAAPERQRAA